MKNKELGKEKQCLRGIQQKDRKRILKQVLASVSLTTLVNDPYLGNILLDFYSKEIRRLWDVEQYKVPKIEPSLCDLNAALAKKEAT